MKVLQTMHSAPATTAGATTQTSDPAQLVVGGKPVHLGQKGGALPLATALPTVVQSQNQVPNGTPEVSGSELRLPPMNPPPLPPPPVQIAKPDASSLPGGAGGQGAESQKPPADGEKTTIVEAGFWTGVIDGVLWVAITDGASNSPIVACLRASDMAGLKSTSWTAGFSVSSAGQKQAMLAGKAGNIGTLKLS